MRDGDSFLIDLMPLTICRHCGNLIPASLHRCPSCGARTPRGTMVGRYRRLAFAFLGLAILSALVAAIELYPLIGACGGTSACVFDSLARALLDLRTLLALIVPPFFAVLAFNFYLDTLE